MNPVDALTLAAAERKERQDNLTIPISVATGTGGALLGGGADALINRLRRMRGNKATSYGGRLAGSAIFGLAGAIGAQHMPNPEAALVAKMSMGDALNPDDLELIRRTVQSQAERGLA